MSTSRAQFRRNPVAGHFGHAYLMHSVVDIGAHARCERCGRPIDEERPALTRYCRGRCKSTRLIPYRRRAS